MESPLDETYGTRMSAYLTTAGDFHRQRKKINKRLSKLRHELSLVTKDTKNYKEKEKISSIDESKYQEDKRHGLIFLLTAERDVLYSLEIKNKLEISTQSASAHRKLMVGKIKKALIHCRRLLSITADESDLIRIELFIYAALIQGSYSINKSRWREAINAFSIAKCGMDFLYTRDRVATTTEADEGEKFGKTLINDILENTVDPSMNLAISQDNSLEINTSDLKTISRKHCHDALFPYLQPLIKIIEKLDSSFVTDFSSSVEIEKTIKWRGRTADVYNDEVALKIMKLTDDKTTNWKSFSSPNEYDYLITGWLEVLDIHSSELEKHKDEDDPDVVQSRAILMTYIKYNLLFTTMKRDLLLIHKSDESDSIERLKDISKLYKGIMSTTSELKNLPGVYNDEDLYISLEQLEKYFEAKDSSILADAFALKQMYPEALKVYNHIHTQLSTFDDANPTLDSFPYSVSSSQDVFNYKKSVASKLAHLHVCAEFQSTTSRKQKAFTVENLNTYSDDGLDSIVRISKKPHLDPLMSKPVLFDIAFNYINHASDGGIVVPSSNDSEKKGDSKKRGGFFGIFGGSS